MVDSMWEDCSRHGYMKNVRDMSAFCPTVGRSATGLVKILITAKRWHSCGNLNFLLCVFVALTTSSIYIAILLQPGTFMPGSNMSSLRQRGLSFPESDRFDAESSRSCLVCLT